jgi:hypothetical protein
MREDLMTALFALLNSPPLVFNFTGTLTAGQTRIDNVSDASQLILQMPVSGEGVPDGAVIANLDPVGLSLPATQTIPVAALLQGFQTTGRRLKFWEEVTAQPAMFLVDGDEEWPQRPPTKPAIITLEAEIWVYSNAGQDPDTVPSVALNTMIEAIDAQLQPGRFSLPQTLGVLEVVWVGIEGRILKTPGHIGGQAIAVIPVKLVFAQGVRR